MAKRQSWREEATKKRDFASISAALDLDLFPNLGEILNGYRTADDKVVEGGSVLMFVGNDGKLTAIVSPKGIDNQFWTTVNEMENPFVCIEKSLQLGNGSWRAKKSKK